MSSVLKTAFIGVGVPIATWFGIDVFWSYLRWTGEAPTYYVASMVGLRGMLVGPVQLVTMGVLAFVLRAAIARTSWIVLVPACVVAAGLGFTGDAIGMHYSRECAQQTAEDVWDLAPHVVGPTVVLLILCALPWAPNTAQQPADAPNGAGD